MPDVLAKRLSELKVQMPVSDSFYLGSFSQQYHIAWINTIVSVLKMRKPERFKEPMSPPGHTAPRDRAERRI